MHVTNSLFFLLLTVFTAQFWPSGAQTPEAARNQVVAALDILVAELVEDRPADPAAYSKRMQAYLEAHPGFYGGAVALLDEDGAVTASPYVYRSSTGYDILDLATPSYNIEAQDWFTMPLAEKAGIWTAPYFDAGGGEIWMITRSVPARDDNGVFAIVTTDLLVDAAQQ